MKNQVEIIVGLATDINALPSATTVEITYTPKYIMANVYSDKKNEFADPDMTIKASGVWTASRLIDCLQSIYDLKQAPYAAH